MDALRAWQREDAAPTHYATPPVGRVRDGWPGTALKKCAQARKRGVRRSNATVKIKALVRAGVL